MSFFSENLKFIRKKLNLTQEEFGEKFGLKRYNIGSYEEARAEPKMKFILKLSKEIGVGIEELFTKKISNTSFFSKQNEIEISSECDNCPYREIRKYSLCRCEDLNDEIKDKSLYVAELQGQVALLKELLKDVLDKK